MTKFFVRCIEKPSSEEFICTDITVNKTYAVRWVDSDDYEIIDDKGDIRYYRQKFFVDSEW